MNQSNLPYKQVNCQTAQKIKQVTTQLQTVKTKKPIKHKIKQTVQHKNK